MMTSKDNQNWNLLHEQNINSCLKLTNQYDFEHLQLPDDIQGLIFDVSSNHNCDPKVLFYTMLSAIGHFGESMNVYNLQAKHIKPITVYEVIIAPSGWDGNKIVKSTISHGTKDIMNKTVSMCIATTGRRWPDFIKELSKVQEAGGLHERCTYFCFDVSHHTDSTPLTPHSEEKYYSNLYDNLLSLASSTMQLKYTLAQVFFVIKLFGFRVLIWSKDAFTFVQPRLNELKTNMQCQLIDETTVFQTKQQMAVRRRAAEHTVRYASLIQIFINALSVLKSMDDKILCSSGGGLNESFEVEATGKIIDLFGKPVQRKDAFHQNGVPIQPLYINVEAATSAIELVFSLLVPQAVHLFNYAACYDNQSNEIAVIANMTSCITERHFRQKRLLVDHVLNDLVERQLLHEGHGETTFFDTKRSSSIKTYLKFIPPTEDEQRFCQDLLRLYNIEYKDYQAKFDQALLLPLHCKLTPYGRDFIRQPQYDSIINNNSMDLNKIDANNIAISNQPQSFCKEPHGDKNDQQKTSVYDYIESEPDSEGIDIPDPILNHTTTSRKEIDLINSLSSTISPTAISGQENNEKIKKVAVVIEQANTVVHMGIE
ncbi:unnamed protein product [Adineta steineri]|uniref:Uncharacterized protein n=1 Tax=Adineta steineri TaxID=433720 RepID=A0A819U8Z0_9BILA|nr:unnamed protein product [Adineta steineri]